jgi:hypothetical protein
VNVWVNRGGYRKNKKVYGEEATEKIKKCMGRRIQRKIKKKLIGVASVKYTNGERSEHIMQGYCVF